MTSTPTRRSPSRTAKTPQTSRTAFSNSTRTRTSSATSRAAHKKPAVVFGSRTDVGCVRQHNEDSLIVSPPLFAVADGMGGHAAGEIASEIAVNTLVEWAPNHPDAEKLGDAVVQANLEVIKGSQDGRGREGMGTTMTAALLEGERLIIAQVGDSRAYLLHKSELQQITRDHSLMADMIEAGQLTAEEARTHPNRSVITRALGSDPHMLADLYEINVEAGDRLLLCSDGLSTMLVDSEIRDTLSRVGEPQRCADVLVDKAVKAGGYDNVTVIVVDIAGHKEVKEKKSARKIKAWVVVLIFALLLVIGGTVGGFYAYTENSFYLSENNGMVAVYKGLPGSLFGIQASQLIETSTVATSDLQPGVASRLSDGIRVDSLDAAHNLIDEYKDNANKGATPGSNASNAENSESSEISNSSEAKSAENSSGGQA